MEKKITQNYPYFWGLPELLGTLIGHATEFQLKSIINFEYYSIETAFSRPGFMKIYFRIQFNLQYKYETGNALIERINFYEYVCIF